MEKFNKARLTILPFVFFYLSFYFFFSLSLNGQSFQKQAVDQDQRLSSSIYAARRNQLIARCQNSLIIIPSQVMSRQGLQENLNFFYLTGLLESGAVLVLNASESPAAILFRPELPKAQEVIRTTGLNLEPGPVLTKDFFSHPDLDLEAKKYLNEESLSLTVRPIEQLALYLRTTISRPTLLYFPFSDFDFFSRTFGPMNPITQAESLNNLDPIVQEMRLTKDDNEIQALREAIDLTAEALIEAFRAAEPGLREVDLAAMMKYFFNRRETRESFLQVASGPNSTNIHFGATSRRLVAGDMIVFDVGTYIRRYTSDISRTLPASGRFTREQQEIYELVLQAQKEGCRRLVAGVTFKAVQDEMEKILLAGLQKLGLVTDPTSPWQKRLYIQHGFGHGIGLEVHDAWRWHGPRLDKVVMKPGMVMTVEPGLYFPEKRLEQYLESLKGKIPEAEIEAFQSKVSPIYARYAGFGVRIEDDVLITEKANEILSWRVPKEVKEIEKMMKEKSLFNEIKIQEP